MAWTNPWSHSQVVPKWLRLHCVSWCFFCCEHASFFCLCCFCSWRQRYFAQIRHWVIPGQKNYPGTYLALEFVQGLTVTSWNGIWPTDKWSWHPSRFPFRTAARAAARKIKSLCQLWFLYERFCFLWLILMLRKWSRQVSFPGFGKATRAGNFSLTPLVRKYSKTHFADPGAFKVSFSMFGHACWDANV